MNTPVVRIPICRSNASCSSVHPFLDAEAVRVVVKSPKVNFSNRIWLDLILKKRLQR